MGQEHTGSANDENRRPSKRFAVPTVVEVHVTIDADAESPVFATVASAHPAATPIPRPFPATIARPPSLLQALANAERPLDCSCGINDPGGHFPQRSARLRDAEAPHEA